MLLTKRMGLFAGFMLVCAASAVAAGVGCSSSTQTSPSGQDSGPVVCPSTVQSAAGAACGREGLVCPIGYSCPDTPITPNQATCTCTSGKFECIDNTNNTVDPGSDPQCAPGGGPNDKQCPGNPDAADTKACKTSGLLCNYAGDTCSDGGVAKNTVCQCKGSADGGLAFVCEYDTCNDIGDASIDWYVNFDAAEAAATDVREAATGD
jgi:hypothetical protein